MRVLLVDPWGGGGITVFYANIARFLRSRDVMVDAYCYQSGWHDADVLEPYCGQLHRNPRTLAEVVRAGDYGAVHLSTDCVVPPFDADRQLRRIRFAGTVIVTAHHRPGDIRLPLETIDAVTAVSPSTAEALRDTAGCDVTVIRNGIDTTMFAPSPADESGAVPERPLLGWVGRADDLANKDLASFLYLAASLIGSDYRFAIVDGGPETSEWVRSAREWHGERLEYSHRLSQGALACFYRRVAASGGALIITSRQEACPLVLLEAWASGCPTIVPDVPGFGEALEFGASLGYRRSSARKDIHGHLEAVRDPAVRERLVASGLELIERRFSLESMGRAYLGLYADRGAGTQSSVLQRGMGAVWSLAYRVRRLARTASSR